MDGPIRTRTTVEGIEFVRTPDDRFDGLPDFAHEPKYVEVDGLRMGYLDEGPPDGPTLLLLHGEPAWSFLYRRMIPPLTESGFRCIAPDLIGFGRSDKPIDRRVYTYERHVDWMHRFLELVLEPVSIDGAGGSPITLFAQDWGGLIGLRVVATDPDRFRAVAVGNTALPVGDSQGPGFDRWLAFSQSPAFRDVGALFDRAVVARQLSDAEIDGYRAPFPDERFLAGALAFPALVPITPEHDGAAANRDAWAVLEQWSKPFLTLWCPDDPVLGHLQGSFVDRIPGAAGQPHQSFRPGGHFLQDDRGEDVATALVDWMS